MIRWVLNRLGWWEWYIQGEGHGNYGLTMSTNLDWLQGRLHYRGIS